MNIVLGILIPFIGTTLGAIIVYFFKNEINHKFEQFLLGYVSLNVKEMIMQGIIVDNNMPLDNLETILNFLKNM